MFFCLFFVYSCYFSLAFTIVSLKLHWYNLRQINNLANKNLFKVSVFSISVLDLLWKCFVLKSFFNDRYCIKHQCATSWNNVLSHINIGMVTESDTKVKNALMNYFRHMTGTNHKVNHLLNAVILFTE